MEATGGEKTLAVGRFVFSKAGFAKAIQIIRDSITREGWLVIDEIGPLELRGEGFYNVLKEVLAVRNEKIVLVVREGLEEEVKNQFKITNTGLIKDIAFINAG